MTSIEALPPRDRKDTKEARRSGSLEASAAEESCEALSPIDSSPRTLVGKP